MREKVVASNKEYKDAHTYMKQAQEKLLILQDMAQELHNMLQENLRDF